MAKAQFPIDGKLGKDFKVTSFMGYRIHPVLKTKKFHNGSDIWSAHEPCWIEAPFDGKVIYAGPSKAKNPDGSVGGFGFYVIILMKINGKFYTTLFGHMQKGSLKVAKGDKITAGTPLGKMGSTGMSTGKHLHWELRLGKEHIWDANGKNYIEPVAFFKALIAQEAAIASAPVVAGPNDPVAPAPTHDDAQAEAVEAERKATKAAVKPAKPALLGELKKGSTGDAVKYLQTKLGLAPSGTFDDETHNAVVIFQNKHKQITKPDGSVGPLTWKLLG